MKITREELFEVFKMVRAISNVKGKIKFAYGISKNFDKIKQEITIIGKAENNTLGEYKKESQELLEKHKSKDNVDPDFIKERDILEKKYEKEIKEQNEFLKEEIDFEFHKIKLEDMPDGLTPGQFNTLENKIIEE